MAGTMTDRELTMLAFLADALASRPASFSSLIEQARSGIGDPSREFAVIVEELLTAFKSAKPSASNDVLSLAKKLSSSQSKAQQRAGHVLKWGFAQRAEASL